MRMVISYSTSDARWRDRLRSFLAPIEAGKVITELWDRGCLQAGQNADAEASAAFSRADLGLVLVSARYLADKTLMEQELPRLLSERRRRGLTLIPVILSPCLWESLPQLKALTPIPSDGNPLSLAQSVDAALHQAATEISAHAHRWHRVQLTAQVPVRFLPASAGGDSSNQETIITRPDELPTLRSIRTLVTPLARPRKKGKSSSYLATLKTMATGAFLFDLGKSLLHRLYQFAREVMAFVIKYKIVITMTSTAGGTIIALEHYQQDKSPPSLKALARTARSLQPEAASLLTQEPGENAATTAQRLQPALSGLALPTANQPPHQTKPELAADAPGALVIRPRTAASSVQVPPAKVTSDALAAARSATSPTDIIGRRAPLPNPDAATKPVSDGRMQFNQEPPRMVSESAIHADILSEERPILPDKAKIRDRVIVPDKTKTTGNCQAVTGSYKVCLTKDGKVSRVQILSGIPNADVDIMASLMKLRYKSQYEPVCFVKQLVFQLGASCGRKTVSGTEIMKDKISENDYPRLPDTLKWRLKEGGGTLTCSYKVCVGTDGSVDEVAPLSPIDKPLPTGGADQSMMMALRRWKFKAQPVEKCFVQILEFHVE